MTKPCSWVCRFSTRPDSAACSTTARTACTSPFASPSAQELVTTVDTPTGLLLPLRPGGDMPGDDEARNLAPRDGGFWAYLGLVTAVGLGLTGSTLLHLSGTNFGLM